MAKVSEITGSGGAQLDEIKPEELQQYRFHLTAARKVTTQYGPRIVFDVRLGDGSEFALFLSLTPVREKLFAHFQGSRESIGPARIHSVRLNNGNKVWIIDDADDDEAPPSNPPQDDIPF